MTDAVDFETRSDVDLKTCGAHVYFESPRARVLLGSFILGGRRARWRFGQPCPDVVRDHIAAGGVIPAHNAGFEYLCFQWLHRNCDWPMPALEQFRCTAATAAAMQLPRSLDKLGEALGLPVRKDKEGHRLIRKFSIPQKDGRFIEPEDDPEDFDRFHGYCDVDVEVEAAADERLVPLSDFEQRVWTLTERINHRGVRIDVQSAQAALRIVEKALRDLDREMAEITGGAVRRCSEVSKLTAWAQAQGAPVDSLGKAELGDVLALDDLAPAVRRALEVRLEAAKTSTAKLATMLRRANKDGRVRGEAIYHAAGTGRTQSAGVNLNNLPRPRKIFEDAHLNHEMLFEAIRTGDPDYLRAFYGPELGRPLHLLSDAIRGFIWSAPGHDLIQADYSNIEGAVVAWLAGEEWKLAAIQAIFDDPSQPDLYRQTAAGILGLPIEDVTKKHWARQAVGKPAELACFHPDTLVLTDRGPVRIVEVLASDLLWDGVEWVKHAGVVGRNARRTVAVGGIEVTPDHLMLIGETWTPARRLAFDARTLSRALATGTANLPSSVRTPARLGASRGSAFSAPAGRRRIRSAPAICAAAPRRAVIRALRKSAGARARLISATMTSCPTKAIGFGCSTVSPRVTRAASIRRRGISPAMEAGVLLSNGVGIAGHFLRTLLRFPAGTTRRLNLTELTWMETMGRATSGSYRGARTARTSGKSTSCRQRSGNLKPRSPYYGPVYDIAFAGPRNRFTVLSDNGALLAHNCGYQGGVSAFYTFARNGGVNFGALGNDVLSRATDEQKERAAKRYENNWKRDQARARELPREAWMACEIIKVGWRAQNAAIAKSWADLEAAARTAVENPGTIAEAARVRYISRFGYLWAQLPSGRCLCYGAPRLKGQVWARVRCDDGSWSDAEVLDRDAAEALEVKGRAKIEGQTSDKVTAMTVNSQTKKWTRVGLYGGLLCENNTQGTARDILVNGMLKAEAAGYPIILTVYDEIIAEVPRGFGDLRAFEKLICEKPAWAVGLPLAADGWRGKRYRKD